jgi:hypothetical protein
MEKRALKSICRLCGVAAVFGWTTIAAHANSLVNPSFETAGTNDADAVNWTMFNGANRHGTNDTTVSIHSGLWSLQTIAPATNAPDASGAYQDVPASPGQNWRLTGYLLTWINAKLVGPTAFGQAQLAFVDGSNAVISNSTVYGAGFASDTPMPVNTWVPFEVDATAPAGTVAVRTYLLYVGDNQDAGSIFFDDVNLYQPSGASTPQSVTAEPAVQISWPTSPMSNGINYQIQSVSNLVITVPPIVNVASNGGFEDVVAPWTVFNGGARVSSNTSPVRTGNGSMRLASTGVVPGCFQNTASLTPAVPITPGQVWSLTGYGYNWSSLPMHSTTTRALIKIVWNNAGGTAIPPVSNDPYLIGALDAAPNYGIVSTPQMTGASLPDTWTFLQAQGTAPANAASASIFCLLVPNNNMAQIEAAFFDDLSFYQPTALFSGWLNLGPLWLGNGHTNQVFQPIDGNKQKFYRVTTQ